MFEEQEEIVMEEKEVKMVLSILEKSGYSKDLLENGVFKDMIFSVFNEYLEGISGFTPEVGIAFIPEDERESTINRRNKEFFERVKNFFTERVFVEEENNKIIVNVHMLYDRDNDKHNCIDGYTYFKNYTHALKEREHFFLTRDHNYSFQRLEINKEKATTTLYSAISYFKEGMVDTEYINEVFDENYDIVLSEKYSIYNMFDNHEDVPLLASGSPNEYQCVKKISDDYVQFTYHNMVVEESFDFKEENIPLYYEGKNNKSDDFLEDYGGSISVHYVNYDSDLMEEDDFENTFVRRFSEHILRDVISKLSDAKGKAAYESEQKRQKALRYNYNA